MTTQVTVAKQSMVPADITAMFGAVEPVLTQQQKTNSLKFAGKVWTLNVDGRTNQITMDVGGEVVPTPMVNTIILSIGKKGSRTRTLFEGGFEEGSNKAPACWSDDGVTPHPRVVEPHSLQCVGCTKSVKGSGKPTEQGKPTSACRQGKVIAVIPSNKPEFPALQLRMSVTSLWVEDDAEDIASNWRSFDAYIKHLANNGVINPAQVITSIKFAPKSNYPRLLFKSGTMVDGRPAFEFINAETAKVIVPRLNSEEVNALVGLGKEEFKPAPQIAPPQAPIAIENKVIEAPVQPKHNNLTQEELGGTALHPKSPTPEEIEAKIKAQVEAEVRAKIMAEMAQAATPTPAEQPVVQGVEVLDDVPSDPNLDAVLVW